MKVLAITGGIGSGKSAVTQCFQQLGATIVDADTIARQILQPDGRAYSAVITCFGEEILQEDRQIHRKKLAKIVFEDQKKLQQLNEITHPCIFQEMERQVKEARTDLVCMEVPLLFSSDFPLHYDKTLAVVAPRELRIARVMERDGVSREEIEARIATQLDDEILKSKADYCIINNQGFAELQKCVKEIYNIIME